MWVELGWGQSFQTDVVGTAWTLRQNKGPLGYPLSKLISQALTSVRWVSLAELGAQTPHIPIQELWQG